MVWVKCPQRYANPLKNSRFESSAPGYRHYGTGALNGIGYDGYSWSSTVSGTNGMRLHFHVTWLAPSYADNRGYGFQLRCLSE